MSAAGCCHHSGGRGRHAYQPMADPQSSAAQPSGYPQGAQHSWQQQQHHQHQQQQQYRWRQQQPDRRRRVDLQRSRSSGFGLLLLGERELHDLQVLPPRGFPVLQARRHGRGLQPDVPERHGVRGARWFPGGARPGPGDALRQHIHVLLLRGHSRGPCRGWRPKRLRAGAARHDAGEAARHLQLQRLRCLPGQGREDGRLAVRGEHGHLPVGVAADQRGRYLQEV
mmetsp:Transcript_52415/g.168972  ORF Transcript_52415/g.168972 Transcript_52415/m.168972 type:complete len:225 (+) Transcript_52415:112-786(+)